jgi:DNA-binding transcriptional MerR regulator
MHDGTVIDGYLIGDAARHSLLTRAMLDYLCREKVVVPSLPAKRGRGRPRRYSFGDLVLLRALEKLLSAGVSVRRVRKALQTLREYFGDISPERLPTHYLVTDGAGVYLQEYSKGKKRLLDLDGTGQMSFFFVLELRDIHREILKSISVAQTS